MTTLNFPLCLAIVLESEGGFSDDPHDPGGVTNHGVTIATWSGYIGHPATIAEMEALSIADVTPLYRAEYWTPAHCDVLPNGVDLMTLDAAVNSGVGRAIRTLQTAAATNADGKYGPATAAAVAACKPTALIGAMADAREAFYRSLPTFSRFGNGWLTRVSRTKAEALRMVA